MPTYLRNAEHGAYLGACFDALEVLGSCAIGHELQGHGLRECQCVCAFKEKLSCCEWEVEKDGSDIYLKNSHHGRFLGACFHAEHVLSRSPLRDEVKGHGVLTFPSKEGRCKWTVESEGDCIYLLQPSHQSYLGAYVQASDFLAGSPVLNDVGGANALYGIFNFGRSLRDSRGCKWQLVDEEPVPLQVEARMEESGLSIMCTNLGGDMLGEFLAVDPDMTCASLTMLVSERIPSAPGAAWNIVVMPKGDCPGYSESDVKLKDLFELSIGGEEQEKVEGDAGVAVTAHTDDPTVAMP